MPTFAIVSLGCPKNQVDSEVAVATMIRAGYQFVSRPEDAEVILVNTCSFIEAARQESVDALVEMSRLKELGPRTLVCMGCLAQQVSEEIGQVLPEVDLVVGTGAVHRIPEAISARRRVVLDTTASFLPETALPRFRLENRVSAYLKIADGCDRTCSFCTIPAIKGPFRSRSIPSLVDEARDLVEQGAVELVLVGQDLTQYGHPDKRRLVELLDALENVPGLQWIRLMYLYPEGLDDGILHRMAQGGKIVPYLDLPIQHISDPILKAMKRGTTRKQIRRLLDRCRELVPAVSLRTTVMVGFPGETADHFRELKQFVLANSFDHLGVFSYSPEPDTASASLPGRVPRQAASMRLRSLMLQQQEVSRSRNALRVGTTCELLVTGPSLEHEWVMCGRTPWQAPDVDGMTYVDSPEPVSPGLHRVRIVDSSDYDLVATREVSVE